MTRRARCARPRCTLRDRDAGLNHPARLLLVDCSAQDFSDEGLLAEGVGRAA
jgi:hypothetical protein